MLVISDNACSFWKQIVHCVRKRLREDFLITIKYGLVQIYQTCYSS